MPTRPALIRSLERHRAASRLRSSAAKPTITEGLMVSWIHHDNMLEGVLYRPDEIATALQKKDTQLPRYLQPLMEEIRRYAKAVNFVVRSSAKECEVATVAALKKLHLILTWDEKDWPGQYRKSSPVHRDYFQEICAPSKIRELLDKTLKSCIQGVDKACDPVAHVAEMHHRLMHVYPYRRNPGTTLRLFTNLFLLSRGYPPMILQAHQRDQYYHAVAETTPEALTELFAQSMSTYLDGHHRALRLLS